MNPTTYSRRFGRRAARLSTLHYVAVHAEDRNPMAVTDPSYRVTHWANHRDSSTAASTFQENRDA